MYYKAISLLITASALLLTSGSLNAQNNFKTDNGETIAQIGEMEITFGELTRYYLRNNSNRQVTADELKEFLPYFVDYKLKLAYGLDNNLDEDQELMNEFNEYAKQASYSYWLERDVRDRLFSEFKERSKYELKSFHLLHRLSENATPDEVKAAKNQMLEAKEKFENGIPIEELDREYSTHTRGQSAGGQLPWFSVGTTVRAFEDALYSLEPGQISEPVRTRFGYHLILLQEKRERSPDRLISHIFIRSGNDGNPYETAAEAYNRLEQGESWSNVVREFTEDGSSAQNNGEIGWIHFGMQFSNQFIESVYSLDTEEAFSEPVQTNYGYHIFRVDSVRTYLSSEHKEEELRERMSQMPNYAANQSAVINRIADVGNYNLNRALYDELVDFYHGKDTISIEQTEPDEALLSQTLIEFNENEYSAADFHKWLSQYYGSIPAGAYEDQYLDEYRNIVIESNVVELTQQHYPDFEREIESYLNGLIVFRVSDDNLWNTATVDSTLLKTFYKERADQYSYPERYSYILLVSREDSTLNKGISKIENGIYNPEAIRESVPELNVIADSTSSIQDEPFNILVQLNEGQISDKFEYRNRNSVIYLKEILPPRKMTFEEAFSRAASDYQPDREELFMENLKTTYNVRIFEDRIK